MEREESQNTDSQPMGLDKEPKRRFSVSEFKKQMGLDKIPVIRKPIPIKKDGKHLYQVVGFTLPLRPETIERLNIPSQKILYELDREQWHKEMDEAREKQDNTPNDPWDEWEAF